MKPAQRDLGEAASLMSSSAVKLWEEGLRAEAVEMADRAVQLYRLLNSSKAKASKSSLATSLNDLSTMLFSLGRREESLALAREAVGEYRQLARINPNEFVPLLAMTINNMAIILYSFGHRKKWLAATQEVVNLYRNLAQAKPGSYLPELATSLGNLGVGFKGVGRHKKALAAAKESVKLYRELVRVDQDEYAFLPGLAMNLYNLGIMLSDLGRYEEALPEAQKAIEAYRQLVPLNPNEYEAKLAMSLERASSILGKLSRGKEAIVAAEEGIALYRRLVEIDSGESVLELTNGLTRLCLALDALNRHEGAIAAAWEAVGLVMSQAARINMNQPRDKWMTRLVRGLLGVIAHFFIPDVFRRGQEKKIDSRLPSTYHFNSRETFDEWQHALRLHDPQCKKAVALASASIELQTQGRREEGLEKADQAVAIFRDLTKLNPTTYSCDLATSLMILGVMLDKMGRAEKALAAAQESADLYRQCRHVKADGFASELASSLGLLGNCLSALGRHEEALDATEAAVDLYRQSIRTNLNAGNLGTSPPDLEGMLINLSSRYSDLGRQEEALAAAQEAVGLYRNRYPADPDVIGPDFAKSLGSLGMALIHLGRSDDALIIVQEAVGLYRQFVNTNVRAITPELAHMLDILSITFRDLGEREKALAAAQEAVNLYRPLAQADTDAFGHDMARSVGNLGGALVFFKRHDEALAAAQEAAGLFRSLAKSNPGAFLPHLASSLSNLGNILSASGRYHEALVADQEAVDLERRLAEINPAVFKSRLALSLGNSGLRLGDLGFHDKALTATQEAVDLIRESAQDNPDNFMPQLARNLSNLVICFGAVRRYDDARAAAQEAGDLLLTVAFSDPDLWAVLARNVAILLDQPSYVCRYHVPLLLSLTERRALARNANHAALFIELQARVTAEVWQVLQQHPDKPDWIEEVVPVIAGVLQSPDLARWLDDHGDDTALRRELADAKRNVMAADAAYVNLMTRLHDDQSLGPAHAGGDRQSATGLTAVLLADLRDAGQRVEELRQQYRSARAAVIAGDPTYRSANETPTLQRLREELGRLHSADGGAPSAAAALLCLLVVREGDASRAVGVLIPGDSQSLRMIEFPHLLALAASIDRYQPAGNRTDVGALPRLPDRDAGSAQEAPVDVDDLDHLAASLDQCFWQPIAQALHENPSAESSPQPLVLHVCSHGALHELPLGLLSEQPGLRLVQWPGLPYFRRAAIGAEVEAGNRGMVAWQLGHDCAWGSDVPLPMAAVEARLHAALLHSHGQPYHSLVHAAELQRGAPALVACCHGSHAAHLDSALALGEQPLTVRQIVEQRLGAQLVVLPVCHAGETRDDAAGNALGVAAGFLLSGTRVVVASAKAVPDLLIPWFTTLLSWHVLHEGLEPYEAAIRARREFGACEFPDGYRQWLTSALPGALAVLQPGGAERAGIERACKHLTGRQGREACAEEVLMPVCDDWPWQGLVGSMFGEDAQARDRAVQSVASSVLRPREDREAAIRQQMREMAAFVFVYGSG